MFQLLLVNPIFNLLLVIYALLPGNDFGLAIIILTIIIRILLWPLLKKQLHSQKAMRELQPEINKIKEKAKGDKQKEGQMMLELYKEREIKPFASLGLTLVQLPILIALFFVLRHIVDDGEIARRAYDFVGQIDLIKEIIAEKQVFSPSLFGQIDLSRHALESGQLYIPAFILAIATGLIQYFQSKQLMPKADDSRRLRDILKDAKNGKQAQSGDQAAVMGRGMGLFFPVFTFVIALNFPAALALYWAAGSLIATIQQKVILQQDVEEMEEKAEVKPEKKPRKSTKTSKKPSKKGRGRKI